MTQECEITYHTNVCVCSYHENVRCLLLASIEFIRGFIKYQQWQKNCNDKVEKVEIMGTVTDAFSELKKVALIFFDSYLCQKETGSTFFSALVSKCDEKHVVLQVDFAENATIVSQNEIQSAHWAHGQATIFTGLKLI